MSSEAQRVRAWVIRRGATTQNHDALRAQGGIQFSTYAWGFRDGSVLVHRPYPPRTRENDSTAKRCRQMWAAFNPS